MIIGIQIVTTGNANPLSVNTFTLNATGTTNQADILNAKLFYTGNSAAFAATTQFGSAIATPTSSDFTITGSQVLSEYTNYFWLTYDIAAGATIGNLADASCSGISIGSQTFVPTISSPTGGTQIGTIANMAYVNSYAVQITDEVNVGTVKAPVLIIVVNTSGTANPLNITQIRVNATGTTNFADIANARIFYSGNSDVFSDGNQFGAVKAAPTSTNFVMTENQPLLQGANYFWLTYDVKETAIVGNKIDGQLRLVWINGVSKTPTTQNPAGNRIIVDNTPEPDMELTNVALTQITGSVFTASSNNEILHLTVETTGAANPLALTGINFSVTGSTSVTDIDLAKVFFTGSSATFATTQQFGNSLTITDLLPATITGSQVLSEGLNHFWIAFDINANAANGNLIDAECYSVEAGGSSFPISVANPAGNREVFVPLAENTVQFGFGTTTTYKYGPMYRSRADSDYDYSRFSYLYTQTELATANILPGSLITKIVWYKTNTANITNIGNAYFDIYMKNSDKTTLINPTSWDAGVVNGASLVASRTFTKTEDPFAVAGWVEFVLDQPFVYSGGALEISTDWNISGVTNYPTNGGFNFRWSEAGPGKTLAAAHDYLGGISSLIFLEPYNYYFGDADGSKRPNIKITWSGGGMDGGTKGLTNLADQQNELAGDDVKIYASGENITIQFSELPSNNLVVFIYNLEGQLLLQKSLKNPETVILSPVTSGLLIVKIQGDGYQHVKKIYLN